MIFNRLKTTSNPYFATASHKAACGAQLSDRLPCFVQVNEVRIKYADDGGIKVTW